MNPARKELADLVHAYLDDARLFADALAELQGQLATVEARLARSKPPQPAVLKEVLALADTPRFRAYVGGTLGAAPQPGLAAGIDDNVRLLGVLRAEMAGYVRRVEALQEGMRAGLGAATRGGEGEDAEDSEEAWRTMADDTLLSAGIVDALKKEIVLIEKVAGAVSVLTPSADVSSYLTILKVQPYLSSALAEQVLAWRLAG